MNFEIGVLAYFEFTTKKKGNDPIKGHYRIADMDKYNLMLTEDDENDLQIIVPKSRITKFEVKK